MNKWNNFETLEHYQGHIWIGKTFKKENRGNICVLQNGDFRVLGYVSPEMLADKDLKKLIYDTVESRGTLWMLEDESLITCSVCGHSYKEEKVNVVDYVDDVCC
ncbi:hypothetical protein [Pseudobacillus badius]|uniref:hypothetical protein n=1 Tax=Bacillus badius TaxID=1455 RepID=UPI003D33D334